MKYEHDVIKDLMPLCIDGIASEKSTEAVKEHIAECADCAKEWESMQKQTTITQTEDMAPDTKQYVKTAKRLKKHKRWLILKIALLVAFIYAGVFVGVRWFVDGARFTVKGVVKEYVKENMYSDYIYLGDVKSDDGKLAEAYIIATSSSTGNKKLCIVDAISFYPLNFMPEYYSSGFSPLDDMPVWTLSGTSVELYDNTTLEVNCIGFLASDREVKSIEYTANGVTKTVTLDKNGYYCQKCSSGENDITAGKALDKDGNVLYTLQTRTGGKNDQYTYSVWDRP